MTIREELRACAATPTVDADVNGYWKRFLENE